MKIRIMFIPSSLADGTAEGIIKIVAEDWTPLGSLRASATKTSMGFSPAENERFLPPCWNEHISEHTSRMLKTYVAGMQSDRAGIWVHAPSILVNDNKDAWIPKVEGRPTSGSWLTDAQALLNMGAQMIDANTVRGLIAEFELDNHS